MQRAPMRDKLLFSDLLYIYIYAYMPNIYMLQVLRYYNQLLVDPNQTCHFESILCKICMGNFHISETSYDF